MSSKQLANLKRIAAKPEPRLSLEDLDALVEQSISYLGSSRALESIALDPYWPKWNSPWWHMMLLHEMGLTAQIPATIVEAIVESLNNYCIHFFPFTEAEVPSGVDALSQVTCHCQLATMHQLLTAYGVDVEGCLSWIRPWYRRYQLGDGGLNCDEGAYTRALPKSSVVSTLMALSLQVCRFQLTR